MTSVEEAASVGLPNLLRSDRPDSEARSFLLGFNLLAWRSPRSYSLNQIRRRWKYLALALGRRDMVARIIGLSRRVHCCASTAARLPPAESPPTPNAGDRRGSRRSRSSPTNNFTQFIISSVSR